MGEVVQLTEPVYIANTYADGIEETTIGGITNLVFYAERTGVFGGGEKIVVCRIAMPSPRFEQIRTQGNMVCIRQACEKRVKPLTLD